jgi:uncharacterized protein (DUF3084 family)
MSTISKVFTIINLVFSLFLVGTVASILSKSEDYKKKFEDSEIARRDETKKLNDDLDAIRGERDNVNTQNRTLVNQKGDLEAELTTARSTAEQLRNDNTQLRNAVDSINASVKALQANLADVEARNKSLMDTTEQAQRALADAEREKLDAQDDRARIEGDLKRANDDIAGMERSLKDLSDQRDNLRSQLDSLVKLGVDVSKLIGNNVALIEGKVSAVGAGFVVLSVGQNEGVQLGTPFDVYRGGDYIGRVVVDNVLPNSSTARVTLKSERFEFQALDNATTRL